MYKVHHIQKSQKYNRDNNISVEKNSKIKIKQGELQGTIENLFSGNTYVSFKGIPYAKPPIGDLRFKVLMSIHINVCITKHSLTKIIEKNVFSI